MLGCVVKKKLALKDKGSEGFNNNDSYNDSHDDNGDHKNSFKQDRNQNCTFGD